jgi:dTDP-4-dehydrorhamnose 3,5-epimerase
MKLLNTKIKGPKILKTNFFDDHRGSLKEIYKRNILDKEFIFDIMSKSKKNVLRGLHIQLKKPQAKLITVTSGKIFDVAVDLRKNSKTYGKHVSLIMSDNDDFSFYIPEGFAHGFVCLSNNCSVYYKCSSYRSSKTETTVAWNDKSINIKWPIKKPILSEKDKLGLSLDYFKSIRNNQK